MATRVGLCRVRSSHTQREERHYEPDGRTTRDDGGAARGALGRVSGALGLPRLAGLVAGGPMLLVTPGRDAVRLGVGLSVLFLGLAVGPIFSS